MDSASTADRVSEIAAELDRVKAGEAAEAKQEAATQAFQRRGALLIAVLAVLLALNALGSANAGSEQILNTIQAANTWAFYQAKNIRQTDYQLAADELEVILPAVAAPVQADVQAKIERYRATVARYESEPDPNDPGNPLKGEGKRELTAQARNFEKQRDLAGRQGPHFDLASSAFQIAIVLGSVAILITSGRLLALCVGLGALATLLMLNGFFLFAELPMIG
jgi:hypothetical protein